MLSATAPAAMATSASTHATQSSAAAAASGSGADASCRVSVKLPSKVVINRSYREYKVTLVDPCKKVDWAYTDLYGPDGMQDMFWFEDNTRDYWDVYDWNTPRGNYKTRQTMAYDKHGDKLPVQETKSKVKYGTKAGLTASRKGSNVTLKASAYYYRPSYGEFRAWNASKATLQYKSGSTWVNLKKVSLKSGKATVTVKESKTRSYRLVLGEDSARWGKTSVTRKI